MSRAQEIAKLRTQYNEAIEQRKLKRASQILARLCSLVTRQLNAENRKKAA